MVGGGVWQTSPEYLKKVRQEIDYSFTNFNKIITTPELKKNISKWGYKVWVN